MTDTTTIDTITNLGGNGAIVALFIWYLAKRDTLMNAMLDKISVSMSEMGDKLEKLANAIVGLDQRIKEVEQQQTKRGRPRKAA